MKIAVGADHRGFRLKGRLLALLKEKGYEVLDVETTSEDSCDYPDIAYSAAVALITGRTERAVLVNGTGIGMSICANKVPGVRAAVCHDELTATMSRQHVCANVLCLGSKVLGDSAAVRVLLAWLEAEFCEGGRHERRVNKIAVIEHGQHPAAKGEPPAERPPIQ